MALAGDKGSSAMGYSVISVADSSGLNGIHVLNKSRLRLIRVSEHDMFTGDWDQANRQNSIGGMTIGDVLMDVGGIRTFDWGKAIPMATSGEREMCKELVWRFHVERSPMIGGSPVPVGKNIFYTETTIQDLQ